MQNEYSMNLTTKFWYKKKICKGWVNVINPFSASIAFGTPGSGRSYAVFYQYIKQQIEKRFSLYCYDFKYPDLSTIVYNYNRHIGCLRKCMYNHAEPEPNVGAKA